MTLDEIVARNARRYPAKPAFVIGSIARSWAETERRVARLAGSLRAQGLRGGDRVAVLLPNCIEYFEIYLACARAGLVAVPLNYRLTGRELGAILAHADAALMIVGADYLEPYLAVRDLLPSVPVPCVVGERTIAGGARFEPWATGEGPTRVRSEAAETDCCAIFYTSGTTGPPKGAMVSHLNLEMNGYNQAIADASRRADVNLVAAPVYHMGAVFMAVTYMMLGCTQVILPAFEAGAWMRTLASQRASVSLLVPTMINAILNDPGCAAADLSSLRLIFYGGGPMPPAVLARALRRFDCAFTQGYGLTETLEATFLTAEDHVPDGTPLQQARLASVGREAVGAEVRIVDERGDDLPPNDVGEILVRSRSVISGYWRMLEATREAIRDGWFHTGDLGYLDADRYLFLVDRKKDMVVSGGVNIYTKEIEAVLYQHPAVLEAAIIGLPDETWGESVTAVVALRPGMTVSEPALIEYCRGALASYKKPRAVHFLPELPKNPSGKILKRELRALFAGNTATSSPLPLAAAGGRRPGEGAADGGPRA